MGNETCGLCGGTKCLTQKGIAAIYLLAWKSSLALIAIGVAAGLLYSPYAFLIAAGGYALPLISADLRLLLYPFVAVGVLLGKKANCPRCEPSGPVFRS